MESSTIDYSSLFYLSPFPKWVYELSTFQILDVNEAAILHYGYSRAEFLKLNIKQLRPAEDISKLYTAHIDIDSKQGNIYFGVFTHQKKSGEKIRMKINGHKVDFQEKKCVMVVCQDITIEERQVELLKTSEARMRAATSLAKLGYWRLDLLSGVLTWSDEIFKIWKRDRASFEVSFSNFFDTIHPEDKKLFELEQNAALTGEKEINFVHRILLPDGNVKWVHELGRLIKDSKGTPIIFEGTVMDISSQKETELYLSKITEQLVESEAKFRIIFEIASLGIAQVDPTKGRILLVNSIYERITGYSSEELQRMNFIELTHPDDREKDWEVFSNALRGNGEYRNEKRYVRKDGSIIWVRLHVTFIRDEEGNPLRSVAICEDISIRKEEEQKLKLFESVVTNTTDAVLITEAEPFEHPGPRILYVNEAFTKMTGYSPEEVIGKTPRILQGPKSDKTELARLSKALRNWESCEITTVNYKKSGEEFWINLSVSPVANETGVFTHWIAIERDVTDTKLTLEKLKKAKEEAEENERKMNEAQKLASLGSWYYDTVNQVSLWSDETYRIWGLDPDENSVNLIDHQKLVHPKDWERFNTVINNAIEKGIPYKMELELVRSDGTFKTVNTIGAPIFDHNNKVIAFKGTTQDISELVTIQKELTIAKEKAEKSEYFMTQASNLAKIGYWEVDLINEAIFWSDQVYKIHEEDPETFTPSLDSAINFYREDYRQLVISSLERCMSTGESFDIEAVINTANKKPLWVRTTAKAERNDGVLTRIYGSFQDINDEKTAAIELEKSLKGLQDYKFSLDQSAIIAYTDVKGIITDVNENFCKISQYTKQELIGKTHRIINSHHHSKEFFLDLWKTIAEGKVWRGEIKNVAKDGSFYWVDTTIVPFMDDKGVPFQYLAIRFDITSRKNADEKVIKTLEEKTNIIESIADAFFTMDHNFIVSYWNKAAEEMLNVKREAVIGKNYWDVFPDSVRLPSFSKYLEALETGEMLSFEEHYPSSDVWFDVSVYPSGDGLSVYFKDVTQRKKANSEIAKSEEKRRLIMNGALDAIITMDTNETISFWNAQAEAIFGWQAQEAMGQTLSKMIIPETYRQYHTKGLKNYLKTGEGKALNVLLEFSALRRNGDEFPIELTVIPIKQGGEEFFCAFIRDISHRKKTEQELLKAFAEKNSILERITEAFMALDSNWCYTYMNKKAGEIFNRDPEEIIGKHIWTEFPEGLNQPFHLAYEKAMETQEYTYVEEYYPLYDLWFENHIYPSPEGISIFFRDVSERKRSQEKLIESEQKYRELSLELQSQKIHLTNAQEVAKVGSWETNLSDYRLTWSDETYHIFGTDRASFEPTHSNFLNYVHPQDREKVNKALADSTLAPNSSQSMIEHRIVTAEGEEKIVEERWKVTFSDKGEPLLAIGSCQDITERKHNEENLLKSNERFEKVTEATNDAIWDWDIENHTFFRSNGIEKFFGKNAEKTLLEKNFWKDNFHKDDLSAIQKSIEKALQNPAISRWEMEYRIIRDTGEIGYVVDKGIIIRNKTGKAVRMVGAMTDHTDRKRYEEELLALNQSLKKYAHELELTNEQLEQFAFIASHDLQEPLRMISSFMDQLKRKYGEQLDDKAHQYIRFATDGAKRMKQIILDLLEYSRAGKFEENRGKINFDLLIYEYKSLRKKIIEEKSAELIHSQLPIIVGYRAPFTQVIHCLLDNAIKYSRKGVPPRIELTVTESEQEWLFEIRDNGLGISPEFFDKIFVIFQRLHNREEYEGSGVGLSIVKKQVESWGGKVWLESSVGEGTTFYFTLPKK